MSVDASTIDIELTDGGESLRFRIKPFSATQGEAWILQAFLLLARAGDKLPEGLDIEGLGKFILSPQGIAALGTLSYKDAEPLLDELLTCCTRLLDKGVTQPVTRSTVDGYMTSPLTLLRLRFEALKANFSFLSDVAPSSSPPSPESGAKPARKARPTQMFRP